MWHAIPDEYVRAQLTVGALVAFGVARVVAAALGAQRGWRIAAVTQWFIGAAVVFCLPQLLQMLLDVDAHAGFVELQGKIFGCALALFCAPIVSHRLGYE
jgi:multisubunit Na+/H+ antiporter MnhE subunit